MAEVKDIVPITISRPVPLNAQFISFTDLPESDEHFAIRFPVPTSVAADEAPLVRVHSECMTGDVFGSARCDCGPQLTAAISRCGAFGGYVLYMRQEGRGIGLYNKMAAYLLQDSDLDTYAANERLNRGADERRYDSAVAMLEALELTDIRLITNNPMKIDAMESAGIKIIERIPTGRFDTAGNRAYLDAKKKIAGHLLP
ncbi:GTP cyclohydrolase II [Stackebrandtia endophytica]|uniref:GTP cyclohydrolase II n=1 Tax=Stackebrandtia endophytica TaxID=1496996 RepID=A0A543AQN6_9ACTN|nr:GTP cyclohydrolase II RibA [Stackebrandtia endophytica]TQL74898.1 GTP cyclohydrolase II [Stackebrandtia endophytica]